MKPSHEKAPRQLSEASFWLGGEASEIRLTGTALPQSRRGARALLLYLLLVAMALGLAWLGVA